jgi:hypothetical protein
MSSASKEFKGNDALVRLQAEADKIDITSDEKIEERYPIVFLSNLLSIQKKYPDLTPDQLKFIRREYYETSMRDAKEIKMTDERMLIHAIKNNVSHQLVDILKVNESDFKNPLQEIKQIEKGDLLKLAEAFKHFLLLAIHYQLHKTFSKNTSVSHRDKLQEILRDYLNQVDAFIKELNSPRKASYDDEKDEKLLRLEQYKLIDDREEKFARICQNLFTNLETIKSNKKQDMGISFFDRQKTPTIINKYNAFYKELNAKISSDKKHVQEVKIPAEKKNKGGS